MDPTLEQRTLRPMIRSVRHQQALDYALQQIRTSPVFPYVTGVYLFGSCAKQKETENSDVDLLLEVNLPEEMDEDLRSALRLLKTEITSDDWEAPDVDLIIVCGPEWQTSTQMFYQNIRKEGKAICL